MGISVGASLGLSSVGLSNLAPSPSPSLAKTSIGFLLFDKLELSHLSKPDSLRPLLSLNDETSKRLSRAFRREEYSHPSLDDSLGSETEPDLDDAAFMDPVDIDTRVHYSFAFRCLSRLCASNT